MFAQQLPYSHFVLLGSTEIAVQTELCEKQIGERVPR